MPYHDVTAHGCKKIDHGICRGDASHVNPKLDPHFRKAKKWRAEGERLRQILADTGLTEDFKWRKPCYTHDGRNIAIIQRMNDFLALMFFKGALLRDRKGVLKSQGENSQSAMRMEFTSVADVERLERTIKSCVREAIKVEDAGLKVPKAKLVLADELAERLSADRDLKAAFEALTPGRRREYNLHISGAKQAKTRVARVDKCAPKILAGKGFRE